MTPLLSAPRFFLWVIVWIASCGAVVRADDEPISLPSLLLTSCPSLDVTLSGNIKKDIDAVLALMPEAQRVVVAKVVSFEGVEKRDWKESKVKCELRLVNAPYAMILRYVCELDACSVEITQTSVIVKDITDAPCWPSMWLAVSPRLLRLLDPKTDTKINEKTSFDELALAVVDAISRNPETAKLNTVNWNEKLGTMKVSGDEYQLMHLKNLILEAVSQRDLK